jgi:hypothetical protein
LTRTHPTEFPPAVLDWLKGQRPTLFRNRISGPVDIAPALNRIETADTTTEIEPLAVMFEKAMKRQELILLDVKENHQDLWHSSFDDHPMNTRCEHCNTLRTNISP